jgi:hypothetical protein
LNNTPFALSKSSMNHPFTGANSSRACCTLPWLRQRRARLMEAGALPQRRYAGYPQAHEDDAGDTERAVDQRLKEATLL